MMHCSTLTDLGEHFRSKVSYLKNSLYLLGAEDDPECAATLKQASRTMTDLEHTLQSMRRTLKEQQASLTELESLKPMIAVNTKRAEHALANMPARFAKTKTEKTRTAYESPIVMEGHERGDREMDIEQTFMPSIEQIKCRGQSLFVPSLEYVRFQDFEAVPKYMKGRLKYDQLNTFVEKFNTTVTSKYKLLATKPEKKLSEAMKKKVRNLKSQESKETKGQYFVTDQDLVEFGSVKVDSSLRSMLVILRHLQHIKEIRGQGVVRYAIIV